MQSTPANFRSMLEDRAGMNNRYDTDLLALRV